MERLKVVYQFSNCAGRFNLHSSMERLKGVWKATDSGVYKEFTFQYGEIKRAVRSYFGVMDVHLHSSMERLKVMRDCVAVPITLEFTFQYGEIKRHEPG